MKCIIIEDEIPAQRILKNFLSKIPNAEIIGCFNSAIKANDTITHHSIDVLFLDINLPDLSGMNYLNILQNPPKVIITTAYPDYAVESFEKDMIVDYLMKPFSFDRFLKAINKVKNTTHDITKYPEKKDDLDHVFINLDKTLQKIMFKDINYIASEHNYVTICTPEKKFTFVDTLKNWKEKLPNKFIQTHKSYIVNTNNITKITGNQLTLHHHITLPIGRTHKAALIAYLNLHNS